MTKGFTDIDNEALDALLERVTQAKVHQLALVPEDYQLLADALATLANMQARLATHDVTIHKLRKLLGIEKSSEKQSDLVVTNHTSKPSGTDTNVDTKKKKEKRKPIITIHLSMRVPQLNQRLNIMN